MKQTRQARALPALSLLLLALLAAPAPGRETAAGEADSLFFERVDINLINVEAFVTDKQGNSVNDLEAEDFEIFEDGQPVEVSNFHQGDNIAPLETAAAPGAAKGPAAATPVAPREVTDQQRLNLVVYVDLFHLRQVNKNKVLKQLGGFLADRIAQGDRIMMVSHLRNVQVIHPFTQDFGRVKQGIDKVAGMATNGQMLDAERRRIRQSFFDNSGNAGVDMQNALDAIRDFVEQQRLETQSSMAALETMLRSLGALPGRRALLYVSDGLEQQPGADLLQTFKEMWGGGNRESHLPINTGLEQLRGDLSRLFDRVAASANTYQVTLYTLQARGSNGAGALSAAEGDGSAGMGGRTNSTAMLAQAEQEPLLSLAAQTGGSAILNTSNFDGVLAELSRDFNSLYSLGYRSRSAGDGKYHKIDVKVKRPGLKVRHRTGFVDAPQEQRVADRAFSALLLDIESNPLGVTVDFATPKAEGLHQYHLPLLVTIPMRELSLLPDGDKHRGKLRLFFAVLDPDGGISQVQEIPYPVEIASSEMDKLQDKDIGYALKLAVREGTPKIAVSVWDEISGAESYLLRSVPVGTGAKTAKAAR